MAQAKRIITIIVIVLGLVGLSVGAFFLLYEPEPEGIIVGITTLPDSLNPVLEQNLTGRNASELVFDGLVNFEVDPESGTMFSEFALADSIEQDPTTKKTYRVGLKSVTWHDGNPVTAADVEFSFAAYMDPENASPQRAYLESFISSVKALDERTVEIEFRKPIPEFRAYPVLTFKIIPSMYEGKQLSTNLRSTDLERSFATKPVGTGPFKVGEWEIGKWVTFVANPSYFRKVPGTETLVLRNIIDPVLRMNEFKKKKINLILETSPMDRATVEKQDKVQISSFMPYSFYQVTLNTAIPAFADVKARKAMFSAVKASNLIPGITDREGLVQINYGPFPADMLTRNFAEYNPAPFKDFRLDEAAALAQAEEAGLKGQNLALLYPDSMGDFGQKAADALVAEFAKIGLTVEAKRTGDQVFRRLVYVDKTYDMALQYLDGFDNVYSNLDSYYRTGGAQNVSGLADKELDQLFDTWNATVVTKDWIVLAEKIHARLSELAPAVPLFSLQKDVYSRGIANIVIASDNPFLSAEDWKQVTP